MATKSFSFRPNSHRSNPSLHANDSRASRSTQSAPYSDRLSSPSTQSQPHIDRPPALRYSDEIDDRRNSDIKSPALTVNTHSNVAEHEERWDLSAATHHSQDSIRHTEHFLFIESPNKSLQNASSPANDAPQYVPLWALEYTQPLTASAIELSLNAPPSPTESARSVESVIVDKPLDGEALKDIRDDQDPGLEAPLQTSGYFVPIKYLRKLQRTMKMRTTAIQTRDKAEYQRRFYLDRLAHSVKAGSDASLLCQTILDEVTAINDITPEKQTQLRLVCDMFQNVASIARRQAEVIEEIHKQMSRIDNDLIRQDNKLSRQDELLLKQATNNLESQSESTADEYSRTGLTDGGTVSARSGTSILTDPLEHDYYDAIGDVTLAREHLYNFETEHSQELYARHNQQQIGGELELSDDDFWNQYFAERRRHIDDYVSGKTRVERLFIQCQEESIRVDEPNIPPLDPQVLDQLRVGKTIHAAIALPSSVDGKVKSDLRKTVEDDKRPMKQSLDARNKITTNRLRVALWNSETVPPALHQRKVSSTPSVTSQDRQSDIIESDDIFDAFVGERTERRYSDPIVNEKLSQTRTLLLLPRTRSRSASSKSRKGLEPLTLGPE